MRYKQTPAGNWIPTGDDEMAMSELSRQKVMAARQNAIKQDPNLVPDLAPNLRGEGDPRGVSGPIGEKGIPEPLYETEPQSFETDLTASIGAQPMRRQRKS